MNCTRCGHEAPLGYSTCSAECNQKPLEKEFIRYPKPEKELGDGDAPGLITIKTLSEVIGVHPVTIYKWMNQGKIPYLKFDGRKTRFRLEEVKQALENTSTLSERPSVPLNQDLVSVREVVKNPDLDEKKVMEISSILQIEPYRDRAMKAAKEAFRDVMLEGADEAKARGDTLTQVRFLEDYIFFEEGLVLIYNRKEKL